MPDTKSLDNLIATAGELEPGTVSIVGTGPGDAAMMTLRGVVRLTQADVIICHGRAAWERLGLSPKAEFICVSDLSDDDGEQQNELHRILIDRARAGQRIVELTEGDPLAIGSVGTTCIALSEAGIRYEIVPGITGAFGAAATAGIPLTDPGSHGSVALITGSVAPENLNFDAMAGMDTIAFCVDAENRAEYCEQLMDAGLNPRTPAAVILCPSCPQQQTVVGTLGDIAARVTDETPDTFSVTIIGHSVGHRERMKWFERRPLHGQTIVVTRPAEQTGDLSGSLQAAGAEVIVAPTITIEPVDNVTPIDAALRDIDRYEWLVLTSVNGVDVLFERLDFLGLDSRHLAAVRIAAVGPATSQVLRKRGILADLVPAEAIGQSLAEDLAAQDIKGKRILLLRANIARPQLPVALTNAGAICDDLQVYRTVCPEGLPRRMIERFDRGSVHWITVTSPSAFVNLLRLLGAKRSEQLMNIKLASIGPVTTRAIRHEGFTESVEADPHDARGLLSAILSHETQ